mgnify:CR=1 FL=1
MNISHKARYETQAARASCQRTFLRTKKKNKQTGYHVLFQQTVVVTARFFGDPEDIPKR